MKGERQMLSRKTLKVLEEYAYDVAIKCRHEPDKARFISMTTVWAVLLLNHPKKGYSDDARRKSYAD